MSRFVHDTMLQCLLDEAVLWPSPGLVSIISNGSHGDMSIFSFIRSGIGIAPYFQEAFDIVSANDFENVNVVFTRLKLIGIASEAKMYEATNNINTHKGIIFLGLIIVAGYAMALKESPSPDAEAICDHAYKIAASGVIKDIDRIREMKVASSTGEYMLIEHGLLGIRGVVLDKFKIITETGLPFLKDLLKIYDYKTSLSQTLLKYFSLLDDTTICNRNRNIDELSWFKRNSELILSLGGNLTNQGRSRMITFEREVERRSISPGGSADLLVLTLFLLNCEKKHV